MSKSCCENPKNLFCFVCGLYVLSHHKRSLKTQPMLKAYESYFKVRTTTENYIHGPPSVCNPCNNALLRWGNGTCTSRELPFTIPMLWSAPTDHATDCYFCLTRAEPSPEGKKMVYPSVKSAVRPKLCNVQLKHNPLLGFHPIECTTRPPPNSTITPAKVIANDNAKPVPVRTYPKALSSKLEPEVIIKPQQVVTGTRHSLPAAKHTAVLPASSVRFKAVPTTMIAPIGVKRKADTNNDVTHDITKIRVRRSDPILQQNTCKIQYQQLNGFVQQWKPVAEAKTADTTANTASPKILNVFSLNKNANDAGPNKIILSSEKLHPKPQSEVRSQPPGALPVTIEIDDDDDEVEEMDQMDESKPEEELKQQQQHAPETKQIKQEVIAPITAPQQAPQKVVQVKQEKMSPPPSAPKHYTAMKMVKVEPKSLPSGDQKPTILPPAQLGSLINLCDLTSSNSTRKVTMVVKMQAVGASRTEPMVTVPSVSKPVPSSTSTVSKAAITATTTPDSAVVSTASEADDLPHRITQSELILLLRELELSKDKSAILIDKLKKWNLLAIELVGPNRSRPSESSNGSETIPQQQSTVLSSPNSASVVAAAAAASVPPTVTSASPPVKTQVQCGQYTATVTSLAKMKDLQVRSTRTAAAKPHVITSSSTPNNSKAPSNVIIKQQSETKPVPKVITTSVTTRSAKIALVKQSAAPARIK